MKNKRLPIDISMIILFFFASLGMLLFGVIPGQYNNVIIAGVILLSAIPHVVIFMLGNRFKDPLKVTDFVFIFVSILIGIIFSQVNKAPLKAIIVVWCIYDLLRATYHLFDSIIEIRYNKLEIIEMIADGIELLFVILLMIFGEQFISVRLILTSVSLFIIGVKFTVDLIISSIRRNQVK